MRSLQLKLTVALLVTSLTAVAIVGAIARWFVFQELNQVVLEISFGAFQEDVRAYFETYGTWEEGTDVEPFTDFVQRRRPVGRTLQAAQPLDNLHRLDDQPYIWRTDRSDRLSEHHGRESQAITPLPDPVVSELERPPFKFLLLDSDSERVLLRPNGYQSEQHIPDRLYEQREPIVVGGRQVALAIPLSSPDLNQLDKQYLASLNRSLLYGMAFGAGSAVILGLTVGGQLSLPLRQLKKAIQAMHRGDLWQQVPVRSRDEIGLLAVAFNQMSSELAQVYDSLQESHNTIQVQANQLRELSIRDELTTLFNRRHFNEQAALQFELARRHNRPLSFAIADIDYFKRINDQFSHGIGDDVLRQVAKLLMSCTRENDIPARYGGEEFVIAFPETTVVGAAVVCERLRKAIETHHWSTIHPHLGVTISVGLSTSSNASNFEAAIAAADRQLYRAKHNGRNRVLCRC